MKCPNCKAKLMPVAGEMFCLQCGTAVRVSYGADRDGPVIEETTDPILQRAITDARQHDVKFRLPVAMAEPARPVASFASMRSVLAPPRAAMAGGALALGGGSAAAGVIAA